MEPSLSPPSARIIGLATARVERFLALFADKKNVLILMHDNPDPDAIASAFGVFRLLEHALQIKPEIAYGGFIGRASNHAMIRAFHIDLLHVSRVTWERYDAIILVDTQKNARDHSLLPSIVPIAVIDHHLTRDNPVSPFMDIGGGYASTTTKVFEYLQAAGVSMDSGLSTALYYGIKSDTRDLGGEAKQADLEAYRYLLSHANMSLLREVEHPQIPREYFKAMVKAFRHAKIYDFISVVYLAEIYTPDLCAEISERLLEAEGMDWSLSMGVHAEQLYLFIRTRDKNFDMDQLLSEVVLERARVFSNASVGFARISVGSLRTAVRKQLIQSLRERFLKALGVSIFTKTESLF